MEVNAPVIAESCGVKAWLLASCRTLKGELDTTDEMLTAVTRRVAILMHFQNRKNARWAAVEFDRPSGPLVIRLLTEQCGSPQAMRKTMIHTHSALQVLSARQTAVLVMASSLSRSQMS